jgi:hypothetical protein
VNTELVEIGGKEFRLWDLPGKLCVRMRPMFFKGEKNS